MTEQKQYRFNFFIGDILLMSGSIDFENKSYQGEFYDKSRTTRMFLEENEQSYRNIELRLQGLLNDKQDLKVILQNLTQGQRISSQINWHFTLEEK